MAYILEVIAKLFPFVGITLLLAASAMALGLIFGCILAAMKMSGNKALYSLASIYTTFIRCTPVLVLLFLSYYGLPLVVGLIGFDISNGSKIGFSIAALTMYSSATLSEIIRPAFVSISRGQYEAAVMSGLTNFQALRIILAPQVFFIALPNFGNMLIALVQESALAYMIGVIDVMGQAKVINSMSYGVRIIEIYVAVSLIYWALSLAVGRSVDAATGRMGKILR